jgi:hypothetical protein
MGELPSPTRHRYGRRSLSVGSNRAMVHAVEARAASHSITIAEQEIPTGPPSWRTGTAPGSGQVFRHDDGDGPPR